MKMIRLFFLLSVISSCGRSNENTISMTEQEIQEQLTNASKRRVQKESMEINQFIKQKNFITEESGTGLRIQIYSRAKNGIPPTLHEQVKIICKVFLLDGTLCYETDTAHPVIFKLGEGEQIRGLEEGLMKMIPGERARLIIPNHLAYSLSGDGDKIPPGAALYIDVKLIK